MKYKIHLYNIKNLWQRERTTILVAFISIICSLSVFFILQKTLNADLAELSQLEREKRTYTITLWPKSGKEIDALNILNSALEENIFPQVEAWGIEPSFSQTESFIRWYAEGFWEESNPEKTPYEIYEGRYFTEEEISSGEKVAIVEKYYAKENNLSVGGSIAIGNSQAEIIGIGNKNILSYNCILAVSDERACIYPDTFNVVFTEELSDTAMETLSQSLYSPPTRLYEDNLESAKLIVLTSILITIGAIFIVVCNISGTLIRLVEKSQPTYAVARLCGGTRSFAILGILSVPLCILTISYVIAWVIYRACLSPLTAEFMQRAEDLDWRTGLLLYVILIIYGIVFMLTGVMRFTRSWFRS